MNLEIYTKRELQNFLSLLNGFEASGISDVRFMRERIENFLAAHRQKVRVAAVGENKRGVRYCKECGNRLVAAATVGEVAENKQPPVNRSTGIIEAENSLLQVYVCKSCGWSEVVE